MIACAAIECKEGRAKRFVQLWTLKEAYVKAVGQGISAPPGLKGFSVLLRPDSGIADRVQQMTAAPVADTAYRISFQSDSETEDKWGFMLLSLSNEHTAAVCLQTSSSRQQLARQNSGDSNQSTDTVFDSLVSGSLSNVYQDGHQPGSQSSCGPVKLTVRGIVPLVADDLEFLCHVEAIGGL